ncbi:hypothetical protein Nocox_36895 [Nonomuraea coxensis DSM 45129]|uniref:Transposase n=1 Tax=Nonomuraea coxensis DSM 45129 TaxID=1122611 RepID=A0ABX8UAZ5_9ACTN|nr:hypothetical protein [Nonomuraea coxensis]QYC44933.1 hypothetical protein Nocox_36895 [Nonomuraea coxensis DSM 45129]
MTRHIISAWSDNQGRVWLDTGATDAATKQPIIELLNGQARGSLQWVAAQFGPLDDLSVLSRARPADPTP